MYFWVSTLILFVALVGCSEKPQLSCRDGKLFEVSHDGNITIYEPTYDECEVTNGIR